MSGRMWRDERGFETLEFVALMPLVLLVLLVCLQFLAAAHAGLLAASAAREGARAAAVGENWQAAARNAAYPYNASAEVGIVPAARGGPVQVNVTVYTPRILPEAVLPERLLPVLHGSATMRCELRTGCP